MTGNPALRPDPTELHARRKIAAFRRRFGKPHLDFASHAAFPLALTPELLHFLWVNFPRDSQRQLLKIPWIATADLLLSSLCAPVGYEMFEMDSLVRRLLLDELLADPRFGPQRVSELAEAMRYFLAPTLSSDNPALRALAQTQDLNTLAHERPQEALEKLALLLRMSIESGSVIEQIRLAALTEALSAALAHQPDFAAVLAYAQQRRRLLHGIAPAAPSSAVPVSIAGIELPSLDTNLPEPISPPQTAPSPAETMDQLIDAAMLNPDPAQRALALTRLLPTLEHGSAARARLHKELIPAVQKITNQPDLLEVLNQYLAFLSPSSPPQYFEDMLQNIRRIPGAAERAGMLARLLDLNALEQASRALSEAVAALSALPQDGPYARLLVRLMPHMRLPERQKASHQVMEIAQKIQDSREQAELLDSVKQALAAPPPPAHTLGEEGAEQDLEQPSGQPQADVSGKGVDAAVEAALRQGGVDIELHITGPGPRFTTQVTYTSQGGTPGDIMRSNSTIELPAWQQEWLRLMNNQSLASLKMEEADARMRVFGTALFSTSFPDLRPGVFARARSSEAMRSRLRLVFEDALEFEDLPWEYLHDGRNYLFQSGKTDIIRQVPAYTRAAKIPSTTGSSKILDFETGYATVPTLPLELPLRVLAVCVAAADLSARRAKAAADQIKTALQPLVDENRVVLDVLENPTPSLFNQHAAAREISHRILLRLVRYQPWHKPDLPGLCRRRCQGLRANFNHVPGKVLEERAGPAPAAGWL